MTIDIFEAYESNVRSYCRSFPAVFARAKNAELFDETGKGYIDFFCGAGALNYGHNNDYIKDKVIEYIANDGIIHSLDMYTHAKREFLEFFEKEICIFCTIRSTPGISKIWIFSNIISSCFSFLY